MTITCGEVVLYYKIVQNPRFLDSDRIVSFIFYFVSQNCEPNSNIPRSDVILFKSKLRLESVTHDVNIRNDNDRSTNYESNNESMMMMY